VGDGWRCLEVGGGGGSITEWLCRRVGPTGRVVATDINTRFLDALDFENLERCVHTTLSWTDSNKECWTSFTLLRALSSQWTPDSARADGLSAKPGGVLLVEEPDFSSRVADPRRGDVACTLFVKALGVASAATGMDVSYGRRLYADMCALGMIDVEAEGRARSDAGCGILAPELHADTRPNSRDRPAEPGGV